MISEKARLVLVDFHGFLVHLWGFKVNDGHIRTPQIKLHVGDHCPGNLFFIGSYPANGLPRNPSPNSSSPHETDLIQQLF